MNDLLIRAEKLIATMKNNKKALLWLRDYESKAKNKPCEWISVKDRLPKMNKQVLTYSAKYAMPIQTSEYCGYYGEDDDEWYEHWLTRDGEVTHWMPLPKLPGENGESDA